MAIKGKKPGQSGNKSVPYFSHEFVIQNHGDIATCFCMIFVMGLMFNVSTPFASTFIALKHNVTDPSAAIQAVVPELVQQTLYTYGFKDLALLIFYTMASIVCHAVIQEYMLDKLNRKVRLSKTKATKFNESGQLIAFYLVSIAWAIQIFKEEGYFRSLNFFWSGYPHSSLTFMTKFYFIIQMSYWIHSYPELYFQKVKKDEISSKILYASLNLIVTAAIYLLNFSRIGLVLLFIDHVIGAQFHISRILHFMGKNDISKTSFRIYNIFFVLARLGAIILSISVFWFGLKFESVDSINFAEGNFNTPLVRLVSLGTILVIQALMMWNFILFQCKKIRENSKPSSSKVTTRQNTRKAKAAAASDQDSSEGESSGETKKAL